MTAPTKQDPIEAVARTVLGCEFLAERAARIGAMADWIAGFSELRDVACNRRAVLGAVWFQDAWCCEDLRSGRFAAPLVLVVQPTDLQREAAADIAADMLGGAVDKDTRLAAARAIRAAGVPGTAMPEAQILAEAVNLDSIGPLWLLGQAARCAADDRSVGSVVAIWERQHEYRYWTGRINETLRFQRSRELARHRVAALDASMTPLRDQLTGGDLHVAPDGPS
ncbi:MAG: hypothetical protein JXQ75_16615 [Phycisphaerae bacterium]|nr:hypothetical protein [Phycisphaerae bacterium]